MKHEFNGHLFDNALTGGTLDLIQAWRGFAYVDDGTFRCRCTKAARRDSKIAGRRGGAVRRGDLTHASKARQALHERIRRQSPQMLRASLEQTPPAMRAMVLRGLGISESQFAGPDGGELLVKRMTERAAKVLGEPQQTDEPAAKSVSLDKTWHGLHYLLCGAAEPAPGALGQSILGGTEFGDDLGYGPARCFTAKETSQISQALQAPGLESILRNRFDPKAMEQLGIYPGGVWDEGPDWLIAAFCELRDFYSAASAAGQAVVTVIE